jgi:hypothetical protein
VNSLTSRAKDHTRSTGKTPGIFTLEVLWMARGSKSNALLYSGAHKALDDMKYEIAAEFGLAVQKGSGEDYWGHITTREAGACGGEITKRLVAFAQQAMAKPQG